MISPPVIVSLKGWKLTAYVENLRKGVKCRPCNKRRAPRMQPTLPTFYDQHLEARSNRIYLAFKRWLRFICFASTQCIWSQFLQLDIFYKRCIFNSLFNILRGFFFSAFTRCLATLSKTLNVFFPSCNKYIKVV